MKKEKTINEIKKCINSKQYDHGQKLARAAIKEMPGSPVFHNLLGVLLEKEHHHVQAIHCFREAYELNPSYEPARYNLERYGVFCPLNNCLYSEDE